MGTVVIAALGGVLLALPGCPALAQAPNDGLSHARQRLSITVLMHGKVFIQATEVPWSALGQRLVAIAKSGGYGADGDVFLSADKSVDYGIVMRAMTEIKKCRLQQDHNAGAGAGKVIRRAGLGCATATARRQGRGHAGR